jgi:hypothetical protein
LVINNLDIDPDPDSPKVWIRTLVRIQLITKRKTGNDAPTKITNIKSFAFAFHYRYGTSLLQFTGWRMVHTVASSLSHTHCPPYATPHPLPLQIFGSFEENYRTLAIMLPLFCIGIFVYGQPLTWIHCWMRNYESCGSSGISSGGHPGSGSGSGRTTKRS